MPTMTRDEFLKVSGFLMHDISEVLESGYNEYAHTSPFNNFEVIGELSGQGKYKTWLVYFLKHAFGIAAWIKGHKSQREGVQGRILDAIAYLFLLHAMIIEDGILMDPDTSCVMDTDAS